MIKLGDTVTWQTTPAHVRTGKVVFIVPAGQSPTVKGRRGFIYGNTVGTELRQFITEKIFSDKCKSELSDGMERNHESYLVEVPAKKEGGKPSIYWPVVKKLKIVKS